jgi:hypothetical protein
MATSEKDRLAEEAMDRWEDFQQSLTSEKRRYPIQQFQAFWLVATRYAKLTRSDSLIHKRLAATVNGLADGHFVCAGSSHCSAIDNVLYRL